MDFKTRGFVRTFVFPALFLFAIPLFSYWFFGHASDKYDANFREQVLLQVEKASELSAEQRERARKYYELVPGSRICQDAQQSEKLGVCSDYWQFQWLGRGALASLLLGVFALLVALVCSGLAFLSRGAQYASFLVGWNVLRVASSLQVVVQGLLLLGLSYWMTALWLNVYVVKLILIVGALAAVAMFVVIRAIFTRVSEPLEVNGELLREADAPDLWAQIRRTCEQLGTAPPQNIIAGIDDNFFVTEGRVSVTGQALEGRTLFISLSLLKNLESAEANAVLAHEMAHFSGGDTQFSKKLSPLLTQYGVYIQALAAGGLSRPIYYFMLLYRALFELSLGRSSRQREHRADQLASQITSPEHAARALVKVGAYSSYRARVEKRLFDQDRSHDSLGIPSLVAQGFSAYTQTRDLLTDLHDSHFPHPFDSHPSLTSRLDTLGVRLTEEDYAKILSQPVERSWFQAIRTADAIEERQWLSYERRFAEAHQLVLAYRFRPSNDEERAHVVKYFPPASFELKEGGTLELTFSGLTAPEWSNPLEFDDVTSCSVNERMFKKYLDIKLKPGHPEKKRSICLNHLVSGEEAFLSDFQRYFSRHLTMLDHHTLDHQTAEASKSS